MVGNIEEVYAKGEKLLREVAEKEAPQKKADQKAKA